MMRKLVAMTLMLFLSIMLATTVGFGQQPTVLLLKQDRDGAPAQNLSASAMARLGDPLFNLVLKEQAHVTNLAELEDLIQPDASKRQTFVVDENIANPSRGQTRRSVLTFTGSNQGAILTSNVMLSVFFNSANFSDTPRAIEAWGWDNHRGRYNYYKLDRTGTPDGRLSWKFRGSSDGADLLSPSDRIGTCMACHINGAPVMKELAFPWNNWHSFKSVATYLTLAANPQDRWPVANGRRLKNGRLKGAEELEVNGILPSITQFNVRRINASLARRDSNGNIAVDSEGFAQVLEGKRLLRTLFVTTEFNIISSSQKSGMHPFSPDPADGPDEDVFIPNSFFLNANLIGGGTPAGYIGLGISRSKEFSQIAKIKPEEYKRLVTESGVRLGGQRGDADFAWVVPEPSHIDNDLADRLMRRGVIASQFLAAVMAIDLENAVLSRDREELLRFIPDRFRFKPLDTDPLAVNRHPDDLTRQVIAVLESSNPPTGSPGAKFLTLLRSQNPLTLLAEQVDAYHQRIKSRLENQQTRAVELRRLHELMVQRRKAVLDHEVLGAINETGNRLFPLP